MGAGLVTWLGDSPCPNDSGRWPDSVMSSPLPSPEALATWVTRAQAVVVGPGMGADDGALDEHLAALWRGPARA